MAASLKARAHRRATVVRQPAIRDALTDEDAGRAVTEATAYLRSELAKIRRRRPSDAALIGAQLAGSLAGIAAGLHLHKPDRPPGCPRAPGPEHLLAVYEAARAAAEGDHDEE